MVNKQKKPAEAIIEKKEDVQRRRLDSGSMPSAMC